ncbi:lantibiotic dehydratase [Streptomyces sp. NPDC002845]
MAMGNRVVEKDQQLYRCAGIGLLRSSAHAEAELPDWPEVPVDSREHAEAWTAWLGEAWKPGTVRDAIEQASPDLARQVGAVLTAGARDVRQVRRTSVSVARYVQRMRGRSTPFGLFAGVSAVAFGSETAVRFGTDHRAVAMADASWLVRVVAELESCRDLLVRLPVMVNTAVFVRGDRLVVPHPPRPHGETGPALAEVSVRHTQAVRTAVAQAQAPIRFDALADKLATEFPTTPAPTIERMLVALVKQHVLITSLQAHSGIGDAFGHVLEQLEIAGADGIVEVAPLVSKLRETRMLLDLHNGGDAAMDARTIRAAAIRNMTILAPDVRRPLAVDLLVDCSLTLPCEVAKEAETAASVLTRLSLYPFGTPAWADYFTRFFARYGVGSPVPLLDLVDPDVGLGLPAGYLGGEPEPREPLSARHRRLLAMAQGAALDGRREIELDERLVSELAMADQDRVQVPPHMELCFQLTAPSPAALNRGDLELWVVSASRAAGTMSGRFLGLLKRPDREQIATVFDQLTVADPEALPVQVSFPPLEPTNAHVARAPDMLSDLISVGEHRAPDSRVIPLQDLAVQCTKDRLFLVSLSRGRRLSPTMLHALDLRAHTPPLVRFLVEVARAQHAVVTGFDWGPALHLPYLPRLRYGRTVLAPARWRLEATDLPGSDASWDEWSEAVVEWRERRRLASTVFLAEGDHRLKLDLDQTAHLVLLRAHQVNAGSAILIEAPTDPAQGWFGGRPHEIVTTMTAVRPPAPPLPTAKPRRPVERDHGHLPGSPPWLHAKLYGHPDRLPHLVARHLPELFAAWDAPPRWWFTRFRDPQWHMRLRIAVTDMAEFGIAAQRINTWAGSLRQQGLLSDMQFASSHPETGRWGSGSALAAAEDVFVADSAALATQFTVPDRPPAQVLAAIHFVSIACDFTGSTQAGMTWLLEHARGAVARPMDRTLLKTAVRLADPADAWSALKAVPGGPAIAAAWTARRQALARYREELARGEELQLDAVLDSLLHAHHIRALGIDRDSEAACRRLARAVALSWRARTVEEGG